MRRINFSGIKRAAGAMLEQLCAEWIPSGKRVMTVDGHQWVGCNPVRNEKNASFSVSMETGAFYDYADPDAKGGDVIALYAYIYSVGMKVAATQLAQRFCVPLYEDDGVVPSGIAEPVKPAPAPAGAGEEASPEKAGSNWEPVVPAPSSAGEPPKAHFTRGRPEKTWCYRGAAGETLGYVYRFVTSSGGKEVLPVVWARNKVTGAEEWHWMQWPMPRPLYGLDRLARSPEATVLVVEGEKCADVGDQLLPALAVMSWSGGCKAEWKAGWEPVAGRRVVLWPDCDSKRVPLTRQEKDAGVLEASKPFRPYAEQPGAAAMARIASKLHELGCEVWVVKVPEPGVKPDGWDIADAVAEGMDAEAVLAFIHANAVRFAPAGEGEEASEGAPTADRAGAGRVYSREDWRDLLLYGGETKALIDCRENVFLMLQHHPALKGLVAANTFAKRIVKTRVPPWGGQAGEWEEHDDLRLGLWLAQAEYLRIRGAENLSAAVSWTAADHGFHPVKDYLAGLKWDGVPRIDHWMSDYLGVVPTPYSTLAGRMFLIGMIARIFKPGCPLRSMPIFEGPQYQGKSTALRILGGEWFSDTPLDLNNKDAYQLIQGIWLYEIAELDSFNRAESTRMKAFISSPVDRFRAPYERAPKDHARSGVFAGTTNQDEYFKDPTGNTRYWPIKTTQDGPIALDSLASVRDQLLAEALVRFLKHERWHPTKEEQERFFEQEQEAREISDPWEALIANWLVARVSPRVTVTEILCECLKIEPGKIDGTRSMSTRVGNIMKRVKWAKRRETSGAREWYYERPARVAAQQDDAEEVSHAGF